MSASVAVLTEGNSTTSGTTFTTASVSPAADQPVYIAVGIRGTSPNADEATITGNGLTWVKIAGITNSGPSRRLTVYRAAGASPSSGAITITHANSQTSCVWTVTQGTALDTTGTNGSGSVVQSNTLLDTASSTSTTTITLGAFGDATNLAYAAIYNAAATADTITFAALTALGTTQAITQLAGRSGWQLGQNTSIVANFAVSSSTKLAVAVELKASTAAVNRKVTSWPRGFARGVRGG